jgi:hypothetical protein
VSRPPEGATPEDITQWTRSFDRSFEGAVWRWRQYGKAAPIAAYLRSGRELSPADREWLAGFIEGTIRLPRGRPPGLRQETPDAVLVAAHYVKEQVAEWEAAGQNRYGLITVAIEMHAAEWCPPEMEAKLTNFVARKKIPHLNPDLPRNSPRKK